MAAVRFALKNAGITPSDLLGFKRAVLGMGTTQFEALAGGTLADAITNINAMIGVLYGVSPSTQSPPEETDVILQGNTVDAQSTRALDAVHMYTSESSLRALHNAITDADATEFDALAGETRANMLLWLADALSILRWNSDPDSVIVGWEQ